VSFAQGALQVKCLNGEREHSYQNRRKKHSHSSMNDTQMLEYLDDVIKNEVLNLFSHPSRWDSLIINRRKPYTYRIFTQLGDIRICLHRFETCDEHEAFLHPHPWPGAFLILKGGYRMGIGYSTDKISVPEHIATIDFQRFSSYAITNPLCWHSVTPISPTYSIMINGTPWEKDVAHSQVRTTKGKDLEKMSIKDMCRLMDEFEVLIKEYMKTILYQ